MEEFLTTGWGILTQIYATIYQSGYLGSLIAIALGTYLAKKGTRITGQPESYSGTISSNGGVNLQKHESITGTAKTWLEHWFGVLLKVAGVILVFTALIAFVNLAFR
ncbi:hypothetical protein H0A66_16020 [Alcaligenaceae bacterium]|nr:hypothetical protein [Alcaligenaceae bacterium]